MIHLISLNQKLKGIMLMTFIFKRVNLFYLEMRRSVQEWTK